METNKIFYDITKDIKHLRTEVFINEQQVPIELEIEEDESKYIHCCIYKEDILIAYARVFLSFPVVIGRVCVKKDYRGLGYGKKLMQFAEAQIKETSEILIHAQVHAIKFYEALGYTCFGDVFLEAGIKHISMKKIVRFYTMNDLAMMTSLTTRTLRNYRKLGLLKGSLQKGKWQFSEEEVEAFFKQQFVSQELIIKSKGLVYDYINAIHPLESLFVVDLASNEQSNIKLEKILNRVNQEENIRFFYLNFPSKAYARLYVVANLKAIKSIIDIIES